jgi:GNAT superfamily N-acetyltransferase
VAAPVTPARPTDITGLAHVLGRAFHDDPVMTWMVPDAGRRARALPKIFATMVRHHFLRRGGVEIAHAPDGRVAAAALWDPPGQWQQTTVEGLRMLPTFLLTMRGHAMRGQAVDDLMKQHHPEEPHWYLGVIGSDPDVRGGGYGHALMRSRLDRCDAEGAPAYLESTKESNVPYYLRFGFEVTGELVVPDGGPTMWPMWRTPR